MKALVFRPKLQYKGDGVLKEFEPESDAWIKLYESQGGTCSVVEIDAIHMDGTEPRPQQAGEMMKRLNEVLAAIQSQTGWTDIVDFSHGFHTGTQIGIYAGNASRVAAAIAEHSVPDIRICFYACAAGGTDADGKWTPQETGTGIGSLANVLFEALVALGCRNHRIDAHATFGDATRNPFVYRYDDLSNGGARHPLIDPVDHLFAKWTQLIRTTDLRFRFTRMTVAEIRAAVVAA